MIESGATSDSRRAALAVHALSHADRTWLLCRLPEHQRLLLLPMLEELQSIGIPRETAMLESIRASARGGAAVSEEEPGQLEVLLAGEPLRLTGLLLAMRDWPAGVRLAGRLGPERAALALGQVASGEPARALRNALMRAVQEAMDREQRPQGTLMPHWRRLVGALRRRPG